MDLIIFIMLIFNLQHGAVKPSALPSQSVEQQTLAVAQVDQPGKVITASKSTETSSNGELTQSKMAAIMRTYQPKLSKTKANLYAYHIKLESKKHKLDPVWIMAMMWQESRFLSQVKSGHGAVGLMQILPSTARGMGVNPNGLLKPETNIKTGVTYLASMKEKFGGIRKATIAYNQGPGNVQKGTYRTWYYSSVYKHYTDMKRKLK